MKEKIRTNLRQKVYRNPKDILWERCLSRSTKNVREKARKKNLVTHRSRSSSVPWVASAPQGRTSLVGGKIDGNKFHIFLKIEGN